MYIVLFLITAYLVFAVIEILYFKKLEKKFQKNFKEITGNIIETTKQKS